MRVSERERVFIEQELESYTGKGVSIVFAIGFGLGFTCGGRSPLASPSSSPPPVKAGGSGGEQWHSEGRILTLAGSGERKFDKCGRCIGSMVMSKKVLYRGNGSGGGGGTAHC